MRAWFAARSGDQERERQALEKLLERAPGRVQAVERLAELELLAGRPESAARLRARKAELDRAKIHYEILVTKPSAEAVRDSAQMARLAEVLGRTFEARALWSVVLERSPGDGRPQAARARLERARAARAELTLAGLLAELGPVPAHAEPIASATLRRRLHSTTTPRPAVCDSRSSTGRLPSRQMPETMSGGVGLLDYDGDGWLDVYLVQGGPFPPASRPGDRRLGRPSATACSAIEGTARSRTPPTPPASPSSRRATATEWPSAITITTVFPTFSSRAGVPMPSIATRVTGLFGT